MLSSVALALAVGALTQLAYLLWSPAPASRLMAAAGVVLFWSLAGLSQAD